MSRCLVTGGAGFIGAHLTRELLSRGHEVLVLDDLSGGFRENVPSEDLLIVGNITDAEMVDWLFSKHRFDYVFHLAAYAAEGLSHFIRRFNYTNNLLGSVNLINASVKHDVKRFVFTSSIAVYGAGELPLRESATPRPEDPYGIAKYAVELDLKAAHELFGLEYTVFRPHNVIGPGQNLGDRYRNVVGIFMNQLLSNQPLSVFGDGSQTRAFSYVGDVVKPMATCLALPETRGETFNVGSDATCSVKQLAETLLRVTGLNRPIDYLPARNEVQHAWADHSKLKQVFWGWTEETPLDESLARMWLWAQKHGAMKPSRFGAIEIEKNMPEVWARALGPG